MMMRRGGLGQSVDWAAVAQTAVQATQQGVMADQTNPLTHLQPNMYYQSTPGGGLIVSTAGVPLGTSALTTTTMGNLLPILLVGGVLVMFMVSRK